MLGVIARVLAVEDPGGIRLAGVPDPKVERSIGVGVADGKGDLHAIGRPVCVGLHVTRHKGDLWRREEVAGPIDPDQAVAGRTAAGGK